MKFYFKKLLSAFKKHLYANCNWLIKLFYQRHWEAKPNSAAEIFDAFSKSNPNLKFIQIGGNDGFQNDPICKFIKRDNWNGVILEPQKAVFPTLKYIYKQNNIIPINEAIADKIGTLPLYQVAFSNHRWATGLACFDKQVMIDVISSQYVKNMARKEGVTIPSNMEEAIKVESVKTTTFKEIATQFDLLDVDLIQIDAEGFDFEVIKLIDFDLIQPKLISFEHEKLSTEDKQAAFEYLESKQYKLNIFDRDAIALK